MKKTIIIAAAAISLTLAGCGAQSSGSASFNQISSSEAIEMMSENTGYQIVDVRTQAEYAGGHIPDAICIPNESIDENVTSMLPDKDQMLFIYCRSGNRSKQAANKLANLGYTNIYEIGGINSWGGEIVE